MAAIYGLGSLNTSTGTEKLVALKDRHFWTYNSGSDSWDLAAVGAGRWLTALTKAYHAEFINTQFWTDGADANRSYNGSTFSTTTNLAGSPIGTYCKVFNNRLYLGKIKLVVPGASGGVISFPSRVWYSELPQQDSTGNWNIKWNFSSGNDLVTTAGSTTVNSAMGKFNTQGLRAGNPFYIVSGTNIGVYTIASITSDTSLELTGAVTNAATGQVYWSGGNWFDVKFDDSDVITGFGDNNGRLLIFKTNSLHRWDENSLIQVKDSPGTTSQNSVINVGSATYYFHPTGIWRDDGVTPQLISEPIWDVIAGMSSGSYDDVVAWTDKARFVKMFIGDVAENLQTDLPAITNCVAMHDVTMDNWSLGQLAHTVSVATPWIESSSPKIYAGFSNGNVYQLETGTDFAGTAIGFRLRTKVHYPVGPEATVSGERIELYTKRGESLQAAYKRIRQPKPDDNDYTPITKAFPVSANDFRGLQFEFTESSTKDSFLLERYSVFYSGSRIEE